MNRTIEQLEETTAICFLLRHTTLKVKMTQDRPPKILTLPNIMGRWLIMPRELGDDKAGVMYTIQDRYLVGRGGAIDKHLFEKREKVFYETHPNEKEYNECPICQKQPEPKRKYDDVPPDEIIEVEPTE